VDDMLVREHTWHLLSTLLFEKTKCSPMPSFARFTAAAALATPPASASAPAPAFALGTPSAFAAPSRATRSGWQLPNNTDRRGAVLHLIDVVVRLQRFSFTDEDLDVARLR
jgi:hypothetical protein